MGFADFLKKEDNLSKELEMLPSETRRKILERVNRRRYEIIEEKLLENQLKQYKEQQPEKASRWTTFREGMKNRREYLKEQGVIKPVIRYNKENFRSPLEEMSRKARADEIKRLENQRSSLKAGAKLDTSFFKKPKDLKLKAPKEPSFKPKRKKKHGFI